MHLKHPDYSIAGATGDQVESADTSICPRDVPHQSTVPAQLESVIELSVCIHPIYLNCVHGGNDERQALAIPSRHDQVRDVDRIMVELDSETRLFTTRRLRTYSKLINLLPCTQGIGTDGFQHRKEAVSRDNGGPRFKVNVTEI
jgi:hypothetical protein